MILQYSEILDYYWLSKVNISLWHTDNKSFKIHGARAKLPVASQDVVSFHEKKKKNYSLGDIYEFIKEIEIGEMSQAKSAREYGIPRETLERKFKKEKDNVAEKRPYLTPVLGEDAENCLVHWSLAI